MLVNRLNLALLFALTSTTTLAATDNAYQHDAGIVYASSSEEFSDGTWNANYRYYLTPVSQDTVPYALSGFLAQTSNLGANYAGFEGDLDAYGVNGQYVFASKWFVGANYQNLGANLFDSDTYGVSMGYYFNSTSSVYLGYTKSDQDYDIGFGAKASADLDTFTLGIRSFLPLETTAGVDLTAQLFFGQSDYSVKNTPYGGDMSNSDDTTALMLSADWYLTRAWSGGANYSVQEETDSYAINTAYHLRLTDSFSAIARASKSFEPDEDGVFLSLGINGRF
ncbi:putative porin [Shewanella sp.]|uniref:putative porin n=1 Tax=Shewanella sp. TaxID=50422 RepID=UPI002609E3A5|nr:putative porin [Shewanella sp.]